LDCQKETLLASKPIIKNAMAKENRAEQKL